MPGRCVFLDRDNTLIADPGYISRPEQVRLLPGVGQAMRELGARGYRLVLVTNQSGIARGLLTVSDLERIHAELRRQLTEQGASLDAIYYCPYHPEGTVEPYMRKSIDCKPSPGMMVQAAMDLDLDLAASWMVGDSGRDIEAGRRGGCLTILLATAGKQGGEAIDCPPDYLAADMMEAAAIILSQR